MPAHRFIADVNSLDAESFVKEIGPVFEHSPWIAAQAFKRRPFADVEQLLTELCNVVRGATDAEKLALIRAHPDLVGRAALAGTLTQASTSEQAAAGLGRLTPEEIARFQRQNAAYRQKFDFPFVICARLNKKDAILAGFERRLKNSRAEEVQAALEEIFKIAELRLRDLIKD